MGFISFSLDYYDRELRKLESAPADEAAVYHAKQLLKVLDDLLDEGYTELCKRLEASFRGVSRLREYLFENGAQPFAIVRKPFADVEYEPQELELGEALEHMLDGAKAVGAASGDAFLGEIRAFGEWIGYEKDTAYVFLLRDTLLPYLCFKSRGRRNIYPWLLSRRALAALCGEEEVDDELRAPIFRALETGRCRDYKSFCKKVLPDMRATLERYPAIEKSLSGLLCGIGEKRIVVVESGCTGTFPMLLKSLDERVELRMFTAYPYLADIYGEWLYSRKYEEIRLFETLYSQDLYFRFSDLRDGRFYVRRCADGEVERRAFAEVRAVLE